MVILLENGTEKFISILLMDAIKLDLNEGNGVVEIVSLLKRYTLDVIGAMAFGVDFASLTPNQRKVSKNLFS